MGKTKNVQLSFSLLENCFPTWELRCFKGSQNKFQKCIKKHMKKEIIPVWAKNTFLAHIFCYFFWHT